MAGVPSAPRGPGPPGRGSGPRGTRRREEGSSGCSSWTCRPSSGRVACRGDRSNVGGGRRRRGSAGPDLPVIRGKGGARGLAAQGRVRSPGFPEGDPLRRPTAMNPPPPPRSTGLITTGTTILPAKSRVCSRPGDGARGTPSGPSRSPARPRPRRQAGGTSFPGPGLDDVGRLGVAKTAGETSGGPGSWAGPLRSPDHRGASAEYPHRGSGRDPRQFARVRTLAGVVGDPVSTLPATTTPAASRMGTSEARSTRRPRRTVRGASRSAAGRRRLARRTWPFTWMRVIGTGSVPVGVG